MPSQTCARGAGRSVGWSVGCLLSGSLVTLRGVCACVCACVRGVRACVCVCVCVCVTDPGVTNCLYGCVYFFPNSHAKIMHTHTYTRIYGRFVG